MSLLTHGLFKTFSTAPIKAAILYVDDEQTGYVKQVEDLYLKMGYLFMCYAYGREAIRDIEGGLQYNMAIIDLSLPDIGGDEVLKASKKVNPNVPVAILSGYSNVCVQGADEHIIKGTESSADLIKIVERALAKTRAR